MNKPENSLSKCEKRTQLRRFTAFPAGALVSPAHTSGAGELGAQQLLKKERGRPRCCPQYRTMYFSPAKKWGGATASTWVVVPSTGLMLYPVEEMAAF